MPERVFCRKRVAPRRVRLSMGALLLATFSVSGPAAPVPAAPVQVLLEPAAADDGRVERLKVTLTLNDPAAAAGEPLLELPLVVHNVDTAATALESLRAADDRGDLELVAANTGEDEADAVRQWAPSRPVNGDLVLSYDVPVANSAGKRGAAPPIEFRAEDGAFSAGGYVFVLRPADGKPRPYSVRWKLDALPAGAAAVSSYGTGNVDVENPLTPEEFARSFFMAGAIGRYGADGLYFGAWQGTPPFDAQRIMRWGESLHADYREFFRPPQPKPFGVFMRSNPVNAGGGVSLGNSFVVTYDSETKPEPLQLTLAHEMFHAFVHSLDEPQGLESSWFGEGLAVHYARILPLRAEQLSPERFLESLNRTAGRYYTNALIDTPNDEIPPRFWEDTRVRVLPYDRGSMYFARLDHRIREASGGERSLDDLLRDLLELRRAAEPMDHAAWLRLLTKELGRPGRREFEAMLDGAVMLPASDAFGPCFRRTKQPLRRYQLGFEPEVLVENPRIVRGLVPESAAARAGLRNGDEILKPVAQDSVQGRQDAWLTLNVRRGRKTFEVRYRPRGETVEAWQWERRPGIPDDACGDW